MKIDRVAYGEVGLRVSVEDDGIGISEEQQKSLFKRFSQVDGSITRRFGGTGLGLAICKQLIELMGGEIGVESREGDGATFWFRVTLKMAAPGGAYARQSPSRSQSKQKAAGVSILLVEDVEVNQDLAKAVLQRMGHTVDIASDGEEAVEKVRDNDYDLVLMDVQMPVMDGVDRDEDDPRLGPPQRGHPDRRDDRQRAAAADLRAARGRHGRPCRQAVQGRGPAGCHRALGA